MAGAGRKPADTKSGNDSRKTGQNPSTGETGFAQDRGKQAVVLIHGMGEQRPLGTLRDFVETIYQRDTSLTDDPDDAPDDKKAEIRERLRVKLSDGTEGNRIWVVPDETTGSAELRRITTQENRDGCRTDFYEFYWADIMDGTPWEVAKAWIYGLLLRSPSSVPPRWPIRIAWILLWVVTGIVAGLLYMAGRAAADTKGEDAWVAALTDTVSQWRPWIALILLLAAVTVLIVKILRTGGLSLPILVAPLVLYGIANFLWVAPAGLIAPLSVLFPFAETLSPIYGLLPETWWLALFALVFAFLTQKILAPYLGDVALYVRATPGTIAKRKAVRDRGMALLSAIHERGLDEEGKGKPYYDRIVLVSHSLGTVIAYDLLQLMWDKYGPTHHQKKPLDEDTAAAATEVEAFVSATWPKAGSGAAGNFDIDAYQAAQSKLADELAKKHNWRVSDFITTGSPLVHADFLMSDGRAALDKAFEERLFPASPPRPDRPYHIMAYWAGDKGPFLHFATPFSAIRWTNIFDYSAFPLTGDVVSGELRPIYGPGIREPGPDGAQCLTGIPIRRSYWPPVFNRLVTHTHYWAWERDYKASEPPAHIRELRKALNLKWALPESKIKMLASVAQKATSKNDMVERDSYTAMVDTAREKNEGKDPKSGS